VGEKQYQPFQLSFNASLQVGFQASRVTSDGGPILVRELDERLGLGESHHAAVEEFSTRKENTQSPFSAAAGGHRDGKVSWNVPKRGWG
jgi:hypothetical protein